MKIKTLLFALIVCCLLVLAPKEATAGYEVVSGDVTVDADGTTATLSMDVGKSKIVDVLCFVPTLDADDTATISLTATRFDDVTHVPRGWNDKGVGATEDNAIIQCNASALDIISDNEINLSVLTSGDQAADRTFKFLLLLEN